MPQKEWKYQAQPVSHYLTGAASEESLISRLRRRWNGKARERRRCVVSIKPLRHEAAAPAQFRCVGLVLTEDPQITWLGDFRPLLLAGELATDLEVEQGAKLRVVSPLSWKFNHASYKIPGKIHDTCVGRFGWHPRQGTTKLLSATGEDAVQIRSRYLVSPASWLPEAHIRYLKDCEVSKQRQKIQQTFEEGDSLITGRSMTTETVPTGSKNVAAENWAQYRRTHVIDILDVGGHTETSISIGRYSRCHHWDTFRAAW